MTFTFNTSSTAASTTPAATGNSGFSFGGNTSAATSAATPAKTVSFNPTPSFAPAASTASTSNTGFSFASTPAASTGFGTPAATSAFGATTTSSAFGAKPAGTPAATSAFGAPAFSSFGATPSTGFGSTTPSAFGTATSTGFGATTASSSLFGSTTPASTFGSFGAAKPATGAFGAPATGLGGGAFGAPANASPNSAITLDTKYETLPESFKKNIVEFGKYITEQNTLEANIRSVSSQKITDLKENSEALKKKVLALRNIQTAQLKAVESMKAEVKEVRSGGELAGQNLHFLKSGGNIQREIELPSRYFWQVLGKFEERLSRTESQIMELEAQLKPAPGYEIMQPRDEAQKIQTILQFQNSAFMRIAGEVAETNNKMKDLKEKYLKMLQRDHEARGGSGTIRNPFEAADRIQAEDERRAAMKLKLSVQGNPGAQATQSPALTAPAPTTSLFGVATTTPAQSTATTATPSLFGATSTTPSTGMFGSSPAKPVASTTTSLFGSTPATTPAATGSLFGATAPATPAPAASTSTSLLGASASPATNLFGATTTPSTPAPGAAFGGFGATSTSKSRSRRTKSKKR